jgi:osmotically-inducible protein OsmY
MRKSKRHDGDQEDYQAEDHSDAGSSQGSERRYGSEERLYQDRSTGGFGRHSDNSASWEAGGSQGGMGGDRQGRFGQGRQGGNQDWDQWNQSGRGMYSQGGGYGGQSGQGYGSGHQSGQGYGMGGQSGQGYGSGSRSGQGYGMGGQGYGSGGSFGEGYGTGGRSGPGYGSGSRQTEYGGGDRGMLERAGDEVASWFGDEGAARRRQMDHRGRGPKGYSRSDDRIREDVSDRLTDDWMIDASSIEVSVEGGEVTLTGEVDSRQAKRHAEDCVESVMGVTHVQNNLRVKSSRGTQASPGSDSETAGSAGTTSGSRL